MTIPINMAPPIAFCILLLISCSSSNVALIDKMGCPPGNSDYLSSRKNLSTFELCKLLNGWNSWSCNESIAEYLPNHFFDKTRFYTSGFGHEYSGSPTDFNYAAITEDTIVEFSFIWHNPLFERFGEYLNLNVYQTEDVFNKIIRKNNIKITLCNCSLYSRVLLSLIKPPGVGISQISIRMDHGSFVVSASLLSKQRIKLRIETNGTFAFVNKRKANNWLSIP